MRLPALALLLIGTFCVAKAPLRNSRMSLRYRGLMPARKPHCQSETPKYEVVKRRKRGFLGVLMGTIASLAPALGKYNQGKAKEASGLPDPFTSDKCTTCYGQGVVTCDLCGGTGKWRALTRRILKNTQTKALRNPKPLAAKRTHTSSQSVPSATEGDISPPLSSVAPPPTHVHIKSSVADGTATELAYICTYTPAPCMFSTSEAIVYTRDLICMSVRGTLVCPTCYGTGVGNTRGLLRRPEAALIREKWKSGQLVPGIHSPNRVPTGTCASREWIELGGEELRETRDSWGEGTHYFRNREREGRGVVCIGSAVFDG
eukprot:69705-Amorphochlora_amoeboformis.AAC.2